MLILALLPILTLLILLFFFRLPFYKTAPFVFMLTLVNSLLIWKIPLEAVCSVLIKALFLTGDIILIIFGAVLFASYMRESGYLERMLDQLKNLTSEKEIQTILFGWLFGGFIEGISGFGTSGAIVAPFLVGLGFTPMKAILVSLASNSTAVTFGAVGTPVRIGLVEFSKLSFIQETAFINIIPGLFVVFFITYVAGGSIGFIRFLREKWFMTFVGGLIFLIPYSFFAHFGSEYPTILGGGMGFFIFLFLVRKRASSNIDFTQLSMSFSPYLLLLVLLFAGKFVFSSYDLILDLGFKLSHGLQFFNPGFAFLTAIVLISFYKRTSLGSLVTLTKSTWDPIKKTFISIFSISAMTYTMVITDRISSYDGMLETISSHVIGSNLTYYASFIGAFGAFMAGSATVSNLLLADIQILGATTFGLSKELILALQLTGAAAGNMIALPNILAIQAAVGENGKERDILLSLIVPCAIYLGLATVVGILIF